MTDQNSAPRPPTVQAPQPVPPGKLVRWAQIGLGVVAAVAGVVVLVAKFTTSKDLPGCDSSRTKDILSDIFKEKKVEASRYDEIKTISSSEDEITCNATLTLRDNSKLELEYRIYRGDTGTRLVIVRANS